MEDKTKNNVVKTAAVATALAAALSGPVQADDDELLAKELNGPVPEVEYVDVAARAKAVDLKDEEAVPAPAWRSILSVPLWFGGHLLAPLLTPIIGTVGSWLVTALLFLLIIGLSLKAIFPDIPLRKIFNKKTVSLSLGAAALLIAADAILGIASVKYIQWRNIFRFTCGALLILTVVLIRTRHLSAPKKRQLILPQ